MSTRRGWFITLEGGEGAGKSSNLAFIRQWLERTGHSVLMTREPGGTPLGERIRQILLHARDLEISTDVEALLMFAARAQHLSQVILPALEQGTTVVCDRFTDATYAYQGGGRGMPAERIAVLERWVQGDLRPDLTILLDVPVAVGLARARGRSEPDRFEREQQEFFERVRACYRARAQAEPGRMRIVDASLSPPEVQRQIEAVLAEVIR